MRQQDQRFIAGQSSGQFYSKKFLRNRPEKSRIYIVAVHSGKKTTLIFFLNDFYCFFTSSDKSYSFRIFFLKF